MKPQPTTSYPFVLDDIIPHLQKVRWIKQTTPRKLMACCPAHDDTNPSLSITETPDGKLLWHCHAGCSQEAVQQALERLAGVKRETVKLIPPREKQSTSKQSTPTEPLTLDMLAQAKRLVAVKLYDWGVRSEDGKLAIHYLTRDGVVSAVQYRLALTGDNRFKWRSGDKPILYGLWRISEWDTADTLYLTEGCTDTWSMWHAGFQACGIPSASTWKPEWWNEVKDFHRIVVIPDTDKAGAELVKKLSHTVPMELASRVYVLRLPDGVKDVNELWIRENADPERFKQALAGCAVVPLMDVSLQDEADELEFVWGYERERDTAHTIVPNLLYAERITILAGEAGVGKTTFALEIADGLTRTGKLWNGTVEVQPARILWLDFDHSWGRLQEILDTYFGFHQRSIAVLPREQLEPLSVSTLPRYRKTIEHYGIDLIIADTAFDWLDVQDGNDETEARVKLQLLRELIAGTGCGVLLLHHPRKTVGDGGRTTALAGSHRFAAKVDVVAFLLPVNRDGMDVVKLIVAKDRDGERLEMELQRVSRKFIPLQRSAVPTGEWGVVKAYLQQHGEATYKELEHALHQAGMNTKLETLKKRVKRWEKRGMVIVEKRGGYPPTAYVKLPYTLLTHSGQSEPPQFPNVPNVPNVPNEPAEPTNTSPLTIEEESEHTVSQWHNSVPNVLYVPNDTTTTTTTDGSNRDNRDNRDIRETPDTTVPIGGGDGEPLQHFTIDENPATGAVCALPQPATVADGTLSTLTHSDNPPIQQPGGLSDTLNPTAGGIEMMNRTNRNSTVDTDTLFRTALQVGFPRFTVVHNGNRLDVEGSYAGWKTALPTLAQQNVMREAYLALNRCRTRKETQPIVLKMEQPDTFSFSTVWRVELTAIEWVDTENGKRLRWVFHTLDDNRTLTALTKHSTEPDSKFARWVRTLLNEPNPPIDTLDLSQLVGKVADGVVVHKQSPNGDGEQLELFNLVRVKRAE